MDSRSVGAKYEELACQYLVSCGYDILDRNFRCKLGEIDIVGKDGEYLCFVEVKYRRDRFYDGCAEAAVNARKQHVICRVSDYYRMKRNISESRSIRFDVVVIYGSEIKLYRNAFLYTGF